MNDQGNIVVVDDTELILKLITNILELEGYRVRSVDHGEGALALVAEEPPELILLDIRMPGMGGFEVLKELKIRDQSRNIPVIFLSGITEVEQVVEGLKMGAVDFISKPFQRDELLARVRNQMELYRLRERLEHQAADLKQANEQLTIEIEERKRAEEALRRSEEHYRAVTYSANDAIVTVDGAGTVIGWNRGAETIFGYPETEIIGKSVLQIIPARVRDRHLTGMSRVQAGGDTRAMGVTIELDGLRKDGTEFPIEFSLAKWETADRRFFTAIFRDITERKRYQENLEYFAIHDTLTGLFNRHSLKDMLNRIISKAKRGIMSSLLYMDLDNFKEVNDSVGHSIGDEVLVTLAGILKKGLRLEDIVFRLGGDEFAVLLDGMRRKDAKSAAERLRLMVEDYQFEFSNRIFPLSLSIGLIQIDGTLAAEDLLSQADAAMYKAKGQGKNQIVVFETQGRA
jgi:diguanylate cyclase (GGDEF)-like protein/PAS domain S-box-containing protein